MSAACRPSHKTLILLQSARGTHFALQTGMPRVSYFFGISIYMYFDDHLPPHFHAVYNEHSASVSVETLQTIKGALPTRALALVLEWASVHRQELQANWEALRTGRPFDRIEPLK